MKSSSIILSLVASTALAQPHKQAVHRHKHEARNREIKWVTEWALKTEIVAVTETIWVSEGYVPPTTTSCSSSTTTARVPAQFFQPVSKAKSPSPSPSPTSTSVYIAPPPVSKPAETTPAPPPYKAPEPETSSSTTTSNSPAPPPEPVQTPEYTPAPVPTTTPAQTSAAAAPTPKSPSSYSGGQCSQGSDCKGDITHYDANAGIGACGWLSDGESENVVALSHVLMGTQSNGNPFCGREITVNLNGKSIVAKVVDKCMGCEMLAIDLSNHAFKELEEMGVGRTEASWYFSD